MRALETLLLGRRDGVAVLTLNRPDCLNALNKQLIDELVTCLVEVGADPMVKCVVLKGAGRIARSPAQALALTKAGINAGLRGGLADVLEFEASAEAAVFQTDFLKDALRAFADRSRARSG